MLEHATETPLMRTAHRAAFVLDVVAGLLFLVILGTLIAQTVMRYVFRNPLTTSQELASLAFIWMIFWTVACSLRVNDHVRFDLVYDLVSDRLKRIFLILCNAFFLAVFVYAALDTWGYFHFLGMQTTASLRLSYQIAFLPYFVFFFLFPAKLALNVAFLIGPGWKARI